MLKYFLAQKKNDGNITSKCLLFNCRVCNFTKYSAVPADRREMMIVGQ